MEKLSSHMAAYYHYWGKATSADSAVSPYHPLPYHCLDVAAVAHVLLTRRPGLTRFFAESIGLDIDDFRAWCIFLIALHDIGKFSSAFQHVIGNPTATHRHYDVRHDTLGYALWENHLRDHLSERNLPEVQGRDLRYWRAVVQPLVAAVTGHHGVPPNPSIASRSLSVWFTATDLETATVYASDCVSLLFENRALPSFGYNLQDLYNERRTPLVSWWLAGFTVLCDWLGSNSDFFVYRSEPMALADYWSEHALPQAQTAVTASGILPVPSSLPRNFASLFHNLNSQAPTPLQNAAIEIPLEDEPQLFILEDVTGSGKTEAAYLLMHRLMARGLADGFYIALPTMATANAMYERSVGIYKRLFDESDQPSLVLAHAARALVPRFTDSVLPPASNLESRYDDTINDLPAGHHCTAWLADHRKKSLLAQAGIGTIDQALLAILKSRHQSLRLFGLLGKVLVVDEVHACDDYVHGLLKDLITAHTAAGGSTILLSATLPRRMRSDLAAAYRRGRNLPPVELHNNAYPLFTRIGETSVDEKETATRPSVRRTLAFRLLHDESDAVDEVIETAAAGRCICWIRNSVDDAIRTYKELTHHLPANQLTLFHARFTLGDRLAIENKVLEQFGPRSNAAKRQGRVVIATQVVEQSLDLDFDQMISDLAPIDLLLQRAGRLRRHSRDRAGNRQETEDRGMPELLVLAPEPTADADRDWLAGLLPKQIRIYPRHDRLWLTATLIRDRRTLRIPEDLRDWMAYVYDLDTPVPDGLRAASDPAIAKGMVDASLAHSNSIDLETGYRADREWWDDIYTPTRLGEATVTLRLARWDCMTLAPWWSSERHPWSYSEVNVRKRTIASQEDDLGTTLRNEAHRVLSTWQQNNESLLLVPLSSDNGINWRGTALDPDDKRVTLLYDDTQGLRIEG